MTIMGFWNILSRETELGKRQPFQTYASEFYTNHRRLLRVGIDVYQWIFELKQNGNSKFPTEEIEINRLLMNFHARIREMIQLNVDFVLVFDGEMKLDKRRWNNQQSQDNNFDRDYLNWVYQIKNITPKGTEHVSVQRIKMLLDDLNIHYITAPGDAEIELGRLNASKLIDAVISNDGDGFVYGANVILRNFSKTFLDKPSTAVSNIKKEDVYFVTPVDMQTLEKHNLKRDQVIFIACFAGDDYGGVCGIGIERAWKLVTKKRPGGMDFVGDLKRIYVSENKEMYIRGQLPFNREQRIQLLKDYTNTFMNEIREYSPFYFGRNCKIDFALPTDFMFATHYYPLYSRSVYEFTRYETNCASLDFMTDLAILPILPQPMSIVDIDLDPSSIRIFRGNDNNIFRSSYLGPDFEIPWIHSNDFASASNWFDLPQFLNMKSYSFPRFGCDSMDVFLDKKLSECYIFKAIVNMKSLNLNFTIDAHKDLEFPKNFKDNNKMIQFTQSAYKVVYKEGHIFGQILEFNHLDKNFQEIVPKDSYTWLPEYILNMHINGRILLNEYNEREKLKLLSPKKTPNNSPRKKKVHKRSTPQKTNLFSSVLQPRSPFKLKNSNVLHLDVNSAKLVNDSPPKKRPLNYDLEKGLVVSKKSKTALDSISDKIPKATEPQGNEVELDYFKVLSNSILGPSGIEFDAEVSNIMDSDGNDIDWGEMQYNVNRTFEDDTFPSDTSSLLNEIWTKSQKTKQKRLVHTDLGTNLSEIERVKNVIELFSEKEEKEKKEEKNIEDGIDVKTITDETLTSISKNNRIIVNFDQAQVINSTQRSLVTGEEDESLILIDQSSYNTKKLEPEKEPKHIVISELSDDSVIDEKFNAIQKKMGLLQ